MDETGESPTPSIRLRLLLLVFLAMGTLGPLALGCWFFYEGYQLRDAAVTPLLYIIGLLCIVPVAWTVCAWDLERRP